MLLSPNFIDIQHCVNLMCTVWWFDTCILQNIATIKLVNTFFNSHSYHFVVLVLMRIFRIYSLGNFQVYNIVLLTTVTMCIRSLAFDLLITGSLYPLTGISLSPPANSWQVPILSLLLRVWLFICLSESGLFYLA